MCLVIDTCCLAQVFCPANVCHSEFKPILNWITNGKGRIIYGGTKYKKELKKARQIFKLLLELRKVRKVIELDTCEVDLKEKEIKNKESNPKFNDPHLVAIVIVSGCRVICTLDKNSEEFIKNKKFYPKRFARPKIYSKLKNKNLICSKNVTKICK